MVNSLATSRGQVKLAIWPILEYGFGFLKWDSSPKATNDNLRTFSTLHPNTFHCTKFNPLYGHYKSELLTKSIAAALFSGPYSVGVTFYAILSQGMGDQAVSATASEDKRYVNKYIAHLRGLKEACQATKGRMAHLQEHWFEFGFEFSGAVPVQEPAYQPITLCSQVRPDTPIADDDCDMADQSVDSNDEPEEPETHPDGRYTAKAKAKGRM
ncbi:hypothetical protein FRC06_010888 [Ceratobasidium sp. 370]|nr:hypothetical protein FRC06_010888 [Ceratobasidium sp. 370]